MKVAIEKELDFGIARSKDGPFIKTWSSLNEEDKRESARYQRLANGEFLETEFVSWTEDQAYNKWKYALTSKARPFIISESVKEYQNMGTTGYRKVALIKGNNLRAVQILNMTNQDKDTKLVEMATSFTPTPFGEEYYHSSELQSLEKVRSKIVIRNQDDGWRVEM